MIVYGLTMQGKNDEVPVEVAAWLLERNSKYQNSIDFQVDVNPVRPEDAPQYNPLPKSIFKSLGEESVVWYSECYFPVPYRDLDGQDCWWCRPRRKSY